LNILSTRSSLISSEVKMYILLKEISTSWNTTRNEFHVGGCIMRTCSTAGLQIAGSLSWWWHKHDMSVVLYFSAWKYVILCMWQRVIHNPCSVCYDSSDEYNKCVTVNTLVIKFVPGWRFIGFCTL
jgi:hypothetical protein